MDEVGNNIQSFLGATAVSKSLEGLVGGVQGGVGRDEVGKVGGDGKMGLQDKMRVSQVVGLQDGVRVSQVGLAR